MAAAAYSVKESPDDSIAKLQNAYKKAAQEANMQLITAIQNSDKEVTINVTLNGSASDFFTAMVNQTRHEVKTTGKNPLLITGNNQINAGVIRNA